MAESKFSIRNRFLAILAVFFSIFLLFALYTDKAARITVQDSQQQSRQLQDVGVAVSDITNTLHLLGIAMYQTTLFDKNEQSEIIQSQLEALAKEITRLVSLPSVKSNVELYQPALKLSENLQALTIYSQKLLEISNDFEQKYPAMPIMLDKLRPLNRDMVGLIIAAIDEARSELDNRPSQEKILALLRDIRYVWSQLVSSVRVFVANRLGAFGPPEKTLSIIQKDWQLYAEVVTDLLNQLEAFNQNDQLGLIQKDALQQMKEIHSQYQVYFKEAANIYMSDNWRADKTLLKNKVDPVLDVAWSQIYLISNRINAYSQVSMNKYASTADKLSNYIWVAVAITMCLLILGYISFEYLIRRPILDIAKALEAEGHGDSRIPHLKQQVKETNVLVKAFADMRNQVRSRQTRLQSILDNAGEGILTLTPDGKIEGVNKAACYLFGYSEKELIGQDATTVIPAYVGLSSQHEVSRLVGMPEEREKVLPGEQEVLGRCKDGRVFPMSLRLGHTRVEENILYTALVSDISERKAMIDRLTQLAERDSLTGLYNRHFLMDELERVVDRSSRGEKQNIALLYIDLDHFKYVNDTLGHLAGDKVLQEVTKILEKRARGTDLLTRLGGDEFAILLYEVDELQAKATAEAYRKQLAEYVFYHEGNAVDVGCSIGVVLFDEYMLSKEELLSRADLACHLAKQSGRNRVHVYVPRDQQDINIMSSDMGWSRRIKSAIEHDEFFQFAQPIIHIKSGITLSNEVLLRLKDNKDQLIMPSGFLPSAERFGLSVELDYWVIKNCFKMLSEQSLSTSGYSINLSSNTIDDEGTLEFIENQMCQFKINPSQVIFEVTESSAINQLTQAQIFLKGLHLLGFKTALDDFGAGYSSFGYLKDLPVDYVKLDGSFIQNLAHDKVKTAIVKAMNEVVHALGKLTVAECVEDATTLEVLRNIGVDYCQGFYTGKPESVKESRSNIHYLAGR